MTGDAITLTNHPWSFSVSGLRSAFALERLLVVNDFTANALAMPHIPSNQRFAVGGGTAVPDAPIGVLGPGSGLGVCGLVPTATGWVALRSEGGHATMAPADERESAVLDRMRRRFDHVSAERVLSGPGLVNLYNTLAEIDGVPAAPLHAGADHRPSHRRKRSAVRARRSTMFCAMLGTVAGNLALTLGAHGGVYIAGGIVPRLGASFAESKFRERFEAKGRFQAYLATIPTCVVTHPIPAFLGLIALLDQKA